LTPLTEGGATMAILVAADGSACTQRRLDFIAAHDG
jgi:hypothetical protein